MYIFCHNTSKHKQKKQTQKPPIPIPPRNISAEYLLLVARNKQSYSYYNPHIDKFHSLLLF